MIVVPSNPEQVKWCQEYLIHRGGIYVSEYAHFLVWEVKGVPEWVVAFDDWVGTTCQLHMACKEGRYTPRTLIRAVFEHAFKKLNRTHVFGIVNSLNTRALQFDLWIGFEEILRIKGAHLDGGDIVVLQMTPETCRWLEKEAQHGQARVES